MTYNLVDIGNILLLSLIACNVCCCVEGGAVNNRQLVLLDFIQKKMMAFLHFICAVALMKLVVSCSSEELNITSLTDRVVEFVFTDLTLGRGLRVVSAQGSLHIQTLNGRSLVSARELEASERSLRLISIGRDTFIQAKTSAGKSRDFFVPEAYVSILTRRENAVLRDLVHILNTSDTLRENDSSRLRESVFTILSYPEGNMLQNAAAALGNAGLSGVQYPAVLPFYMATLRLAQLVRRNNVTDPVNSALPRGVREDCLSECPPCPYQECLGLCGYGCNCWKWVCGDCCYHLGCYEHDICCRQKFVRTACLFPFSFKCESGYNCD